MVLQKTLPLVFIFLIGLVLKKTGILKEKYADTFLALLVYLVVPAAIIQSFLTIVLSKELIRLPLIAVAIVSAMLGFGYFFAWLFRLQGPTRAAFIISFPSLEGGTVGYAFMFAAFGAIGLSKIVLFDFGNAMWEFTILYFVASFLGKQTTSRKEVVVDSLKEIGKNTFLWAEAVGIGLNLSGFRSALIDNFLGSLSSALPIVGMLFLALKFETERISFKLPLVTVLLKLTVGILLGFAAVEIFNLKGLERMTVLVGASLPTSLMAILFSEKNKLDSGYVATLLAIAIPFDLVFITILRNFF